MFSKQTYYYYKISGIYKITHKPSGMCYIGKSKNIFDRWASHYTDIKKCKHSSTWLTFYWQSSKPNDWKFEILENVDFDDYKLSSKLPIHMVEKSFDTHLLDLEKKHMREHSKNLALNADSKYFS
jgi:hypothetical protein